MLCFVLCFRAGVRNLQISKEPKRKKCTNSPVFFSGFRLFLITEKSIFLSLIGVLSCLKPDVEGIDRTRAIFLNSEPSPESRMYFFRQGLGAREHLTNGEAVVYLV